MLGLGVNTRVLMIGAHPDDEDTNLITWLSRGRHVTTAYLSLTRGDGGQNIIGNELGEALGVLRTEELLAARRIDGAWQYFTRAYDFGFSKDTIDAFAHWPRDTILGDVVRVVRAFRPHVIVAVFSGTSRDGHGQHQVSGILAREAYDVAGDTVRFPVQAFGQPWVTPKFYRAARGNAQAGTLGVNVGEYSPLRGESYGEIAGRSRSQHKSQAFGSLERPGRIMNYVRREASRVNEGTLVTAERSIFDGIDTTWARLRPALRTPVAIATLERLPDVFRSVRDTFDPFAAGAIVPPLIRLDSMLNVVAHAARSDDADALMSLSVALSRTEQALRLATGIVVFVNSVEEIPVGRDVPILAGVLNRWTDTIAVSGGWVGGPVNISGTRYVAPGESVSDTITVHLTEVSQPRWLEAGRSRGTFNLPARPVPAGGNGPYLRYSVDLGGHRMGKIVGFTVPVEHLFLDQVRGEQHRPAAGVPAVAVRLADDIQIARADAPLTRDVEVDVSLSDLGPRDIEVALRLPAGLTADSTTRVLRDMDRGQRRVARFRVSGRLVPGNHTVAAVARSEGRTYETGFDLVDYEHIRRQRIYRPAAMRVQAVDVRIPDGLRVAYVAGVSDNVAPALEQLGIPTTVIPAAELARADLSRFSTVVIGPRAYDANPELINANPKLFDFARAGGTVVVQYGQYEMTRPGYTPFPITINRPHDRVTHEDAPVTILDPTARELTFPNRITAADFDGWVQERSLYMPRTFDERYRTLLAMSDPGESAQRGAILVAPMGRGRYVYTSLAFFRQLPAGVPGATRLFVNLLSAGLPATP